MTMDTQNKFTNVLDATAAAAGYRLITDQYCGNIGTFRIQRADRFGDLVSVRYNFQEKSASFQDAEGFRLPSSSDGKTLWVANGSPLLSGVIQAMVSAAVVNDPVNRILGDPEE